MVSSLDLKIQTIYTTNEMILKLWKVLLFFLKTKAVVPNSSHITL